jgi:hypothetical protein
VCLPGFTPQARPQQLGWSFSPSAGSWVLGSCFVSTLRWSLSTRFRFPSDGRTDNALIKAGFSATLGEELEVELGLV